MTEVASPLTGNVWKIRVEIGSEISKGDVLVILESMKMEIPVESEVSGTVQAVLCSEGETVTEGQALVVVG